MSNYHKKTPYRRGLSANQFPPPNLGSPSGPAPHPQHHAQQHEEQHHRHHHQQQQQQQQQQQLHSGQISRFSLTSPSYPSPSSSFSPAATSFSAAQSCASNYNTPLGVENAPTNLASSSSQQSDPQFYWPAPTFDPLQTFGSLSLDQQAHVLSLSMQDQRVFFNSISQQRMQEMQWPGALPPPLEVMTPVRSHSMPVSVNSVQQSTPQQPEQTKPSSHGLRAPFDASAISVSQVALQHVFSTLLPEYRDYLSGMNADRRQQHLIALYHSQERLRLEMADAQERSRREMASLLNQIEREGMAAAAASININTPPSSAVSPQSDVSTQQKTSATAAT